MSETFIVLLVVEIALTALTLVMWMWRGFLDMKEDDRLVLSDVDASAQQEQAAIRARVNSLSRYIKVFGVLWVVVAVVTFGAWVVTELNLV
jgi:hypothetical protein